MHYTLNKSSFTVFVLLLCLSACGPNFIKSEAPAVNEIEVGQEFTINLPENHNDGYTWQLSNKFNSNLIQVKDGVWHGNEKGIYFNFKALKDGELRLDFVKRKYTDTSLVKCFIVKIKGH